MFWTHITESTSQWKKLTLGLWCLILPLCIYIKSLTSKWIPKAVFAEVRLGQVSLGLFPWENNLAYSMLGFQSMCQHIHQSWIWFFGTFSDMCLWPQKCINLVPLKLKVPMTTAVLDLCQGYKAKSINWTYVGHKSLT